VGFHPYVRITPLPISRNGCKLLINNNLNISPNAHLARGLQTQGVVPTGILWELRFNKVILPCLY
jgi:hypothetical protein